jgi:tetratricopeptide (TPR) repeat protein
MLEFDRAGKLFAQGNLAEAESCYRSLLARAGPREIVLRALVELFLRSRRAREAIDTLVALTMEVPDSLYYYARLGALLEGLDQPEAAISHYERLVRRQPVMAAAHFNLALLYKKVKRYKHALDAYEAAIRLGIDRVEEVYSNMGVLYSEMRKYDQASAQYQRALETNPVYIPALFNLAGLLEESGKRQEAISLYERVLKINPRHWDSLSRLAQASKVTSGDEGMIERLLKGLDAAADLPDAQEGLNYALGKVLDDLGRYDDAFKAYQTANNLAKLRHPPYDRIGTERAFSRIIELINENWMNAAATDLTAAPIFICGMFRSGSTLVEQMLAAHPGIQAGGELDFLPWLIAGKFAPYPEGVVSASQSDLAELGNEYLSRLQTLFPNGENITDKQPDNFLRLGLIKAVFPRARIVYTKRNLLDNCLSVYFQQLDAKLIYAGDIDDIRHYYGQQERLMSHWLKCLGDNVYTVNYDELVKSPQPVLRGLIAFLGLDWDERCMRFQRADVLVKTASVWQVRDELHSQSSGRWRNYASHLEKLIAAMPAGGATH